MGENERVVDYGAILADLEAKKAAIDTAITGLKAAMSALGTTEGMSFVNLAATIVNPSIHGDEVPAGAFLGKSIPEAAKLYLSIVKKKQTTREITDALRKGGMETTSNNFENIVGAGLNRSMKTSRDILRVGKMWALPEWYPVGIRSAATQEKRKTGKSKKRNQRKSPEPAVSVIVPNIATNGNKKTRERIAEFLRKNPGHAYTPHDVSEALKIDPRGLHLILGRLVSQKVAEKVDDKYRAVGHG